VGLDRTIRNQLAGSSTLPTGSSKIKGLLKANKQVPITDTGFL